jgi:hypothetical protein
MRDMKPSALIPSLLLAFACSYSHAQLANMNFSDLAVRAPELIRLQSQFEQMPPLGVTIESKEIFRKGTSGKDLDVRYNIYVRGVPPDSLFRQIQWPVDREKPIPGFVGITLNNDGLMICAGRVSGQCHSSARLDAPITFAMQKPLKGEPRRSVFITQNLRIPISIIPDPIQGEDRGCRLSAIRLSAKFELAMIEGFGFPPNSDIRIHMSDDGSARLAVTIGSDHPVASATDTSDNFVAKADGKGTIQMTSLKNTGKNPTGTETVEATGPACSPKLSYEWGVF